jgi:uncharacterized protein (TIGR03083 family)
MDKRSTLTAFRGAYAAMGAAIYAASDEDLTRNSTAGWCVRDVLAHFAGYHNDMALAIEAVASGARPPPTDGLTDDERNAQYAQEARFRAPEKVTADWRLAFERCFAAASACPQDVFSASGGPGAWITEETAHYEDHTRDVRDWLGLS